MTYPAITSWYASLDKPAFTPPNGLFGPVWTVLYALMGVALYLVWTSTRRQDAKHTAFVAFGVQLVLNVLWSVVFFGLQRPDMALMIIVALWAAIAITIYFMLPVSRKAAYLMAPYLAWVTFAAALNIGIVSLNG